MYPATVPDAPIVRDVRDARRFHLSPEIAPSVCAPDVQIVGLPALTFSVIVSTVRADTAPDSSNTRLLPMEIKLAEVVRLLPDAPVPKSEVSVVVFATVLSATAEYRNPPGVAV